MDTQPWERQEGETSAAYRAFTIYRDMGLERSVLGAYKLSKARSTANRKRVEPFGRQVSPTWLGWQITHHWENRAREWDNHQARTAQHAVDKATYANATEWAQRNQAALELGHRAALKYAKYAEKMADEMTSQHGADSKEARDWVSVLNTAMTLLQAAITAAMPQEDITFDPRSATTEELRAYLARKERQRHGLRVNPSDVA